MSIPEGYKLVKVTSLGWLRRSEKDEDASILPLVVWEAPSGDFYLLPNGVQKILVRDGLCLSPTSKSSGDGERLSKRIRPGDPLFDVGL